MSHWGDDAACRGTDHNLFFDEAAETEALLVCSRCPVKAECLGYAVTTGQWDGVFGGMNVEQRKRWAKQNNIPRHGTLTGYATDLCRCEVCREEATYRTKLARVRREARKKAEGAAA